MRWGWPITQGVSVSIRIRPPPVAAASVYKVWKARKTWSVKSSVAVCCWKSRRWSERSQARGMAVRGPVAVPTGYGMSSFTQSAT